VRFNAVVAVLLIPAFAAALLALKTLVVKPTKVVSTMKTLLRSSTWRYGPPGGRLKSSESATRNVLSAAITLSRAESQ